ELMSNIRKALQERSQISLGEVIALHPLHHGLAELVTYLQIAGEWPHTAVDEETEERIVWEGENGATRKARLPRIIFVRND
ncbi:MAG: DUF3375 domain-containing protein, partial [Chlorobiales bacterium]|nr:DUF3375 domain-containing protein [Chlorobiales bacterium]